MYKKSTISIFSMITNSNISPYSYFSFSSLIHISYCRNLLNNPNFIKYSPIYNTHINIYFINNSNLRWNISKLRTRHKKNYCSIHSETNSYNNICNFNHINITSLLPYNYPRIFQIINIHMYRNINSRIIISRYTNNKNKQIKYSIYFINT